MTVMRGVLSGELPRFSVCEVEPRGEDPLATEMRLFCSCQRWTFNRLLEGSG